MYSIFEKKGEIIQTLCRILIKLIHFMSEHYSTKNIFYKGKENLSFSGLNV